MRNFKIAVVGSGISGLSSAYYLSKNYKVDLFEKNSYFGGHTHTQTIKYRGKNINVDSGFIVFNEINYPNLCKLFEELNIKSYESDMSLLFQIRLTILNTQERIYPHYFLKRKIY